VGGSRIYVKQTGLTLNGRTKSKDTSSGAKARLRPADHVGAEAPTPFPDSYFPNSLAEMGSIILDPYGITEFLLVLVGYG
jgi:hypothetical protein